MTRSHKRDGMQESHPTRATTISGCTPIEVSRPSAPANGAITEPLIAGRSSGRLVFDFGVMASLLKPEVSGSPVLDFGAGTGWVSEFCVRMGMQVVAFDLDKGLKTCLEGRANADLRIDPSLLCFANGDGHHMPFAPDTFGHLLCYDTLHHMHDYPRVFSEFHRVLHKGGRAIFVEPGARHSSSPETVAFVEKYKKHDPDWIERDVVLEEIDRVARGVGFNEGVRIVPMPHPLALQIYSMDEWSQFRKGDAMQRARLADQLADLNYWDRIVFYVDKA